MLLHCILYYNSKRIVERFPYSADMLNAEVQPTASSIWNYAMNQPESNLIDVSYDTLICTLLPRTTGCFGRNGLTVNKLRYRNENYTERYLKGGKAIVAYNPDDISSVWLMEEGTYTEFELVEGRFRNQTFGNVKSAKAQQKQIVRSAREANTQAHIDLINAIDVIAASAARRTDTRIHDVRNTRKKERNKAHVDYMKEGELHEL